MSKKNPATFIDIFAGCGGLSLGLTQAGWQGIFAIERDEHAFSTFHHNLIKNNETRFQWPKWLPQTPLDATSVLQTYEKQLKKMAGTVDMIVGGPPCQGFSTAGRRKANDPRNTLVQAYLKLVQVISPKIVLIENVKGITLDFANDGEDGGSLNYAQEIVKKLSNQYDVSTKLMDTSMWGVPQKRHRFIIIAIRKDLAHQSLGLPFDLLEKDRGRFLRTKEIATVPVSTKSAISDLEVERNGTMVSRDTPGFQDIRYTSPLTSYQRLMNQGCVGNLPDTRLARHKPEIKARFQKFIRICHEEGRLNVAISKELKAAHGLKKCAIRVLDPESPSPTITSMPDDLIHYAEPRALTVRENARLQSFPDWFAFQGKYTSGGQRRRSEVPRFTQVANAVPPLFAEGLGATLKIYITAANLITPKVAQKVARNARNRLEAVA